MFFLILCVSDTPIYYLSLDFSNVVPKSIVKSLAEADDQEVVKEIQVFI